MSQVYGIGDTAKKLYVELADRLAGPLQAFLPATWIGQALGGMVRNEIWTHVLAYNLVRAVMWEAAEASPSRVRRLSVKGTLQHPLSFGERWQPRRRPRRPCHRLLRRVAAQAVSLRPGRIQPRVRKRRPKSDPLMARPRSQLKAAPGGHGNQIGLGGADAVRRVLRG